MFPIMLVQIHSGSTITILLFYSLEEHQKLLIIDQDVLLLVILASVLILAMGSMFNAIKSIKINP